MRNGKLWFGSALVCSTVMAGVAHPQTVAPPAGDTAKSSDGAKAGRNVEEVVVTAQKRAQRLQDVPIAVSVVGAAQLGRQQVNTLTDLERTTPELEFSAPLQAPGGGATVRGIGTQVFAFSGEASVGVVLDGVSLGTANTNNIFDTQRVEILPGPQGMLFGQSASAGLLNITTNAPDPSHFYGNASTELAQRGVAGSDVSQYVTRLVVNQPINETTAVRIALHYIDSSVQYDAYNKKYDDSSDPGIRARFLTSGPNWTLNLIGDYDRDVGHGGGLSFYSVPPGSGLTKALASPECGFAAGPANSQNCNTLSSGMTETAGLSGQLDYQVGEDTLTLISAWRELAYLRRENITTVPPDLAGGVVLNNDDEGLRGAQVSQEIRIASPSTDRLEYTAGLYFVDYSQYHAQPSTEAFPPFGVPLHSFGDTVATDSNSEAVFGQLTYHVTPKWKLIAGGRLSLNKVKDRLTDIADPGTKSIDEFNRNASWRLGTQYSFSRNLTAYFTVSKGFKGPLISDTGSTAATAFAVKPEIPLDFELGTKASLLDGRLAADLSLFHSKVRNFQTQGCYVDPVNHLNTCGAENVSSVTTQGVQLNVFGHPFDGVTLNSGILYNDARYPHGFLASDGTDLGGDELINAPLWKLTVSGEYRHAINDRLEGFLDADGVYKSSIRLYPSASNLYVFHNNWIGGLRAGVEAADQRWSASVFVRNLFDVHTPLTFYPFPLTFAFRNTPSALWGDYGLTTGRMVGFSGSFRF